MTDEKKINGAEVMKEEQLKSVVGGANLNVDVYRKPVDDKNPDAIKAGVQHFPTAWD